MDDKSCLVMDRILNNRGRELMALNRYSEAIDDFNRSLNFIKWQKKPMVSELAKNYYNRGFAYLKTGQFRLAINDFNFILEPIPKEWAALYFYKAQAFEGLLEMNSARQIYEKACLNGVQEGCEQQKKLEDSVK
jgi:tetratricopeptide (TPR) repeat protein